MHMKRISPSAWMLWMCLILFLAACKKDNQKIPEGNLSTEHTLTSFVFKKDKNPSLRYDVKAEIIGDTVFAYALPGVEAAALIPDFTYEGKAVAIGNVEQQSGHDKQDFSDLITYNVRAENGDEHSYIIKLGDTGLPAVYIVTDGKAIDSKEDYVDAKIRISKGLQKNVLYEGDLKIRGRGNSTWGMPKKPFRLKLNEKAPLLGMPSDKNWALMANYGDKSLLRNDVAFELSRRLELEYTPRQQYVELFLNGEYIGNYNLTEHVKEGKNRINIDEDNGGYILEADGYAHQEPVYFDTPKGMPITVKFPDEDDITGDQLSYITDYYTAFENSLFATDFNNPTNGYQQYFDLESFVNYYLVNEICGNPDMFWSMRMYKKSSGDPKIYTGPVWDFDLGFNNDSRLGDAVKKLMLTDAHEPKQWISRFAQDPNFKKAVRERWNTVKASKIKTINEYVTQQAKLLSHSQHVNFLRWNILNDPNIHLNWYLGSTYQDYITFLENYLTVRINWLDGVINGQQFD